MALKPTKSKTIEIVGGPNGSGKSTLAESFLLRKKKTGVFINADTIATGISPLNQETAAFAAGRLMVSAVQEALAQEQSFAFEATLSGRAWLPVLKNAAQAGYRITIYFVFISGVKESLQRIQARVRSGGHAVPAATVARRYPRCFENFWKLYRPVCEDWYLIDNSGSKGRMILSKAAFDAMNVIEKEAFSAKFLKRGKNGKGKANGKT